MNHQILDNELRAKIKKIRLIETAVCAVSFVLTIFFWIMYDQSRVVEEVIFGYQSVTYNTAWLWGIMPCVLILIFSFILLCCDLIFTKLDTVEVNGYYVTLYRGYRTYLYVDGELKDTLGFVGYFLEATLPDRTKVTVSLGKWSAHLTFSNGHPPIDLWVM